MREKGGHQPQRLRVWCVRGGWVCQRIRWDYCVSVLFVVEHERSHAGHGSWSRVDDEEEERSMHHFITSCRSRILLPCGRGSRVKSQESRVKSRTQDSRLNQESRLKTQVTQLDSKNYGSFLLQKTSELAGSCNL